MKNISIPLLMILIALNFTSCKKLIDSIEPKSFVEKFYDKTLNHEWIVDSIRYTKFDESKKLISDDIRTVGKIIFQKPIQTESDPALYYGQGYMIHTYMQNGASVVDKKAYRLKNSGTEIKYLEITEKPTNSATFKGFNEVIFDIQQLDKNNYNLYRYEHLQDIRNGQWQGYLRSVIKMHR